MQHDAAALLSQVTTFQVTIYVSGSTRAVVDTTVSATGAGQQTIGPFTVLLGSLDVVVCGVDFQGLQLEQGSATTVAEADVPQPMSRRRPA